MLTYTLAPIILFTYNRPWHTKQTLEALLKNDLASDSVLYIYSDGPKLNASADQINKINEVREIIHAVVGFKDVIIVESDVNKGLANSIISGVTEVMNIHEKVIVLEDDLITSPYFLKYMNISLRFYEDFPSVFSISADRPPQNKMRIPDNYEFDVFVSLRPYSTGWATWNAKWKNIDWSLKHFDKLSENANIKNALNRGGNDLFDLYKKQYNSEIDSWAIRFCFHHFANHSISILPVNSFVYNIGFDGSGTHSPKQYRDESFHFSDLHNFNFLDILYEDKWIINAFYSSFYPKKRPIWEKIINRISRILGGENVFVIKKKIYC